MISPTLSVSPAFASTRSTRFRRQERLYWDTVESLPRPTLEAMQLHLLRRHLARAQQRSPWYRHAFAEAGVDAQDLRTLDDLRRFPFTDKKLERDRQLAAPLLGDLTAVTEEDVVFVSASSGSTGVATLSPFTARDFDEYQDVQARLFWAAGLRPTDRYLHALNFTLFVGGPDVIGAQRVGALSVWAGTLPSERLLHLLRSFQITTTWTTPSYAWHLGEAARAQGIDPAKDLALRRIIVAGEPGGSIPATRRAIEQLWNADIYDFYGLSDIFGACAGMCRERDGLHLAEDHILAEVLDPRTGEPVPDGQDGELVLTTLRKRARPLIRFRTGDTVVVDPRPCPCGRTHKRFTVKGRIDDLLIISGVNVYPSDVEFVVRNQPHVTGEYRITLRTVDHLARVELEVERSHADGPTDAELERSLAAALKVRLGIRPSAIHVLAAGALPRATHKAKRVVDLRQES